MRQDAAGGWKGLDMSNFTFSNNVFNFIQELYFHLKNISRVLSRYFQSSAAELLYVKKV